MAALLYDISAVTCIIVDRGHGGRDLSLRLPFSHKIRCAVFVDTSAMIAAV